MANNTMNYWELLDDIYSFPERWQLGDIEGLSNWVFTYPKRDDAEPRICKGILSVKIAKNGEPLDYTMAGYAFVPIVSNMAAAILEKVGGVEFYDIDFASPVDTTGFKIMRVLNAVDCLDERESDFKIRQSDDPVRPDLAGDYYGITHLVLNAARIGDAGIFRLSRALHYLIVSDRVKELLEKGGVKGAYFLPIDLS
jgi:hypothetical protein